MNKRFLSFCILFALLWGCSPVRRLGDDQYLLAGAKLKESQNTPVKDQSDYYQFKTNAKLLGLFRLRLQLHQSFAPEKTHWFAKKSRSLGEAPKLFDAAAMDKTQEILRQYYFSEGYFNAQVSWTAKTTRKKIKKVEFYVQPGKRYTIDSLQLNSESPALNAIVLKHLEKADIQKGKPFRTKALESERKKITALIRDRGYYFFAEQYIYFDVDTNLVGPKVYLSLNIQNPQGKDGQSENHKKYYIQEVHIQPDFKAGANRNQDKDTVQYNGYHIVSDSLRYKPRALVEPTLISPGKQFSQTQTNNTYNQFSDLQGFSSISIQYQAVPDTNLLRARVQLQPLKRHSTTFEIEGTHRVGNWGTALNYSYRNRNIFRGNEILEIKPSIAFETNNQLGDDQTNLFNTFEYGIETSIKFPRFLLPFNSEGMVPKSYSPRTTVSLQANKQERSDFSRFLLQTTFGFLWREGRFKTHKINWVDLTYIRLAEGSSLNLDDNPFLASLFTDQVITANSYQFTFNNQRIKSKLDYQFFRGNFEVSGHLLRALAPELNLEQNADGVYKILGVPFAQYIKVETDYRYYHHRKGERMWVGRIFLGRGFTMGNSELMPFGKQYFAGGANDVRAWTAYQLGPGSFSSDSVSFNTGNIKLTVNAEYRFKIAGPFKGAVFTDLGNIWNSNSDETIEVSDFQLNGFYKQVAIGAGIGLRYDFGFFIFRLDYAQQIHDPSAISGNRWMFDRMGWKTSRLNLGLGYPF